MNVVGFPSEYERMCVYVVGATPNRWGFTSNGCDSNTLIEPIPPELSGCWLHKVVEKGCTEIFFGSKHGDKPSLFIPIDYRILLNL